ncbi:methyltransferase domain-containing protein [Sphingomonas paucimobilis]|uniref:Methyltransferase domain-containing protein n=1 Tax=Sphingomonas paucimobilis TaxID=13689 RepID=A0A7Y2PDF1_SPHPI|nr:methyltransferase domain-containing protein [Sphingomonas paucimobilis]
MKQRNPVAPDRNYVPALGRPELTGLYDYAIALLTRERRWRTALLQLVAPSPSESILDVGCGTGSFAIMVKQQCPAARVIGVDPDPAVLEIARAKATKAGVTIEWVEAMGDELARTGKGPVDKVVSSLVFHQCTLPMKRTILAAMHDILRPGGALFVADYGEQRSRTMRALFRQIQRLDGFENTQPNADGVLPRMFAAAGFEPVIERESIQTPTGSISIYSAHKP